MNCCPGVTDLMTCIAQSFLFDPLNKCFGDAIIDIGFEQSQAHFTDSFRNILFGQLFLPASLEKTVLAFFLSKHQA